MCTSHFVYKQNCLSKELSCVGVCCEVGEGCCLCVSSTQQHQAEKGKINVIFNQSTSASSSQIYRRRSLMR